MFSEKGSGTVNNQRKVRAVSYSDEMIIAKSKNTVMPKQFEKYQKISLNSISIELIYLSMGLIDLYIISKKEYDNQQQLKVEQKLREQIRGIIKEQLNEQKLMKILLNKKDMSKLQKAMKKYPFKSLPKFKQKGSDIELNVPKKEYNKAVEFLMKNKLNPRG